MGPKTASKKGNDMTDRDEKQFAPAASRRAVLLGAGALGAVGVLAACGTSTDTTNTGGGPTTGNGAAAATSDVSGAGGAVKAADIPVGGGKIFADQKIVVTQPTAGTYKAFSAVCPHAGCLVTTVDNGKIVCPCHGSEFKIADGSVARGPATTALAGKTVTPSGGNLAVA
jgi:nitrite reductase/ring-hydroxylating ferredoxin subunit